LENLRCTVKIASVLANSKTQYGCLFSVHAMFRHDYPLAGKPASTPQRLVRKRTWRVSPPIDMLLSAVSVLVVAQPISEFPERLMNYPILINMVLLRRRLQRKLWGFFFLHLSNTPCSFRLSTRRECSFARTYDYRVFLSYLTYLPITWVVSISLITWSVAA